MTSSDPAINQSPTFPHSDPPPWRKHWAVTLLRVVAGVASVVIGVGIIVLTAALGDCGFFGGSCPREPWFDEDIFSAAAFGAAIAVGVPMFVSNPSSRRFVTSLVTSLVAGAAVGLAVVSATAS